MENTTVIYSPNSESALQMCWFRAWNPQWFKHSDIQGKSWPLFRIWMYFRRCRGSFPSALGPRAGAPPSQCKWQWPLWLHGCSAAPLQLQLSSWNSHPGVKRKEIFQSSCTEPQRDEARAGYSPQLWHELHWTGSGCFVSHEQTTTRHYSVCRAGNLQIHLDMRRKVCSMYPLLSCFTEIIRSLVLCLNLYFHFSQKVV